MLGATLKVEAMTIAAQKNVDCMGISMTGAL